MTNKPYFGRIAIEDDSAQNKEFVFSVSGVRNRMYFCFANLVNSYAFLCVFN